MSEEQIQKQSDRSFLSYKVWDMFPDKEEQIELLVFTYFFKLKFIAAASIKQSKAIIDKLKRLRNLSLKKILEIDKPDDNLKKIISVVRMNFRRIADVNDFYPIAELYKLEDKEFGRWFLTIGINIKSADNFIYKILSTDSKRNKFELYKLIHIYIKTFSYLFSSLIEAEMSAVDSTDVNDEIFWPVREYFHNLDLYYMSSIGFGLLDIQASSSTILKFLTSAILSEATKDEKSLAFAFISGLEDQIASGSSRTAMKSTRYKFRTLFCEELLKEANNLWENGSKLWHHQMSAHLAGKYNDKIFAYISKNAGEIFEETTKFNFFKEYFGLLLSGHHERIPYNEGWKNDLVSFAKDNFLTSQYINEKIKPIAKIYNKYYNPKGGKIKK